LIEDGRRNLMGVAPWDPGRPVDIIHGRLDSDVPFSHSQRLVDILRGSQVRLSEVADGEHRLSRPEDLELLFSIVEKGE
ncbi:MAG: alpha/beta hydrolase family protein, partial [Hyphomicrobiaceae bacterium]